MMNRSILAVLLYAMVATAQSTTTISMFLNMQDSHPTPIITASILRANPTATTYVANCDYTDDSERCAMTDLTVTTGPSWQDFTSSYSEGFYRMSCTFTGSERGACAITQQSGVSAYSDTIPYDPVTNTFPGFMKVLVTGGVEKLASQTASSSRPTGGGVTATSSAESGQQSTNAAKNVLPPIAGYISGVLVVLGLLCL